MATLIERILRRPESLRLRQPVAILREIECMPFDFDIKDGKAKDMLAAAHMDFLRFFQYVHKVAKERAVETNQSWQGCIRLAGFSVFDEFSAQQSESVIVDAEMDNFSSRYYEGVSYCRIDGDYWKETTISLSGNYDASQVRSFTLVECVRRFDEEPRVLKSVEIKFNGEGDIRQITYLSNPDTSGAPRVQFSVQIPFNI